MRFRYYVPDDGDAVDDAREVYYERYVGGFEPWEKHYEFDDHEDAAEYAGKLHHERSAPDWNDGEVTIAIVDTNGAIEVFDVSLEYTPSFSVSRHKA